MTNAEAPRANGQFRDKVVLVTGAGSGMGRAMVEEFSARGASVAACDIDAAAAESAAAAVGGLGVTADLGEADQVRQAVAATLERFGAIDVLCSNAGLLDDYATALETEPELWNRLLRVNLTATYLLSREVLPGMIERGSGSIITTCSLASFIAGGGGAAYTSTKHALLGFTRQLAYDYAAKGIRANAICPGLIETGMTRPLLKDPESGARKFVEETPSQTWGQPEEVAKLAAFLASDDAPFINGAHVSIDGGWTIK
jgi:3-oxoacyl-[acyl-carrier protein] reductase